MTVADAGSEWALTGEAGEAAANGETGEAAANDPSSHPVLLRSGNDVLFAIACPVCVNVCARVRVRACMRVRVYACVSHLTCQRHERERVNVRA